MLTLAYLAFLDCGLPKNVSQLRNGWFFEKMSERRPPPKLAILGGVCFLTFFQKNTKCLKMTLENRQKSGFYIVKFSKLQRLELAWVPQFFDQKIIRKCYLYVLENNGNVFCQFQGYFVFSNFCKENYSNTHARHQPKLANHS